MANKQKQFPMRVDEAWLAELDAWRRDQADLPGRAEAVRRLVALGRAYDATLAEGIEGDAFDRRAAAYAALGLAGAPSYDDAPTSPVHGGKLTPEMLARDKAAS